MKIIYKKNISKLNLKKLIEKEKVIIIKKFFKKEKILSNLQKIKKKIKKMKLLKVSGPNYYLKKNYNRLDIGDYSQVNARFSRMIALFEWNKYEAFEDELKKLVIFRDKHLGLSKEKFIYKYNKKRFYNLQKVLHYPSGGGFMNKHTDGYNNDGFPNFLVCITKKGKNYFDGGAYYEIGKKEIDVEEILDPGDIYFHSTNTLHGVRSIDYKKKLDLENLNKGRWAINLSLEEIKNEEKYL